MYIRPLRAALVLVIVCVAALGGCGDGQSDATTTSDAPPTSTRGGDGAALPDPATGTMPRMSAPLTIPQVLQRTGSGPWVVSGYLMQADGQVRLCESIAESFPPQCGGRSLVVTGADDLVTTLPVQGGVHVSDQPVILVGEVRGGVIHHDADLLARI